MTDKGRPSFVVAEAGRLPMKTAEDLRREAREVFPGDWPKVNFTALMKSLKK